jgi:hypothetical protein
LRFAIGARIQMKIQHISGMGPARKVSAARRKKQFYQACLFLALAMPVLAPGDAAFAQTAGTAAPVRQPTRHRVGLTIDDRVKGLAKTLELSEAQQSAVKAILVQRQQETLHLRLDSSISGSARIEQFRALQIRTVERIRAVLNDEQKKKYDPLASDKIQREPGGRSVEDWINLTTPH